MGGGFGAVHKIVAPLFPLSISNMATKRRIDEVVSDATLIEEVVCPPHPQKEFIEDDSHPNFLR